MLPSWVIAALTLPTKNRTPAYKPVAIMTTSTPSADWKPVWEEEFNISGGSLTDEAITFLQRMEVNYMQVYQK